MTVLYMPGCTLKNKALNFDRTFVNAMERLEVPVRELDRWNCCGTVFSQTSDDLMLQLAPIRNLLRAEQQGEGPLLVPCSMCYNTLKRAMGFLAAAPDRLEKVRSFMYEEASAYQGRMEVQHPLQYLRDTIGFERVKRSVERPLGGLKLAAYYGCLLTRPAEAAIDDPTRPHVFEDLLQALGGEAIEFEGSQECCGAYQTMLHRAVVARRNAEILGAASRAGAQALVTSCPLCAYNLDQMQREGRELQPDLGQVPVFYWSELLDLALGARAEDDLLALHHADPRPVLSAHGLC